MKTNELPKFDMSDNPTGCCPRFHPETWEGVELHFKDKPFARAETRLAMHIPVNMGKVFDRMMAKLEPDFDQDNFIVLSRDLSAWKGEHLFATDKPVEGEEMVSLSGDFVTKVFEGPFKEAGTWHQEMQDLAADRGTPDADVYFFYTTCPRCAKVYGKNYIVGLARI